MAKKYYLPTVTAIAVASFTPTDDCCRKESIIAVEYINYGIIAGLQITSLTDVPVTIKKVLLNREFFASLHAPREDESGSYLCRRFPRRLSHYGDSFITITDAPAAPDDVRQLCYGKPVMEVVISTSFGDWAFKIGNDLADHWMISDEQLA